MARHSSSTPVPWPSSSTQLTGAPPSSPACGPSTSSRKPSPTSLKARATPHHHPKTSRSPAATSRSPCKEMPTPSEKIDNQIASLTDWRGQRMAELRKLINEADPNLKEDWKWDTAVWTAKGNVIALGA